MFNQLKEKINEIKKMGWIPYEQNNCENVNLKIKKLLKINSKNSNISDYKNKIKIKTRIPTKENKLSLFTVKPDNNFSEIKRIYKLYSYNDRNNPNYKILNQEVISNKKVKIKNNVYFSLKVNSVKRIIQLIVYDNNGNLIDKQTSWSFELLRTKLERKLKLLCYIETDRFYINGQNYVKYKQDNYYTLKDFDTFINLIDNGTISFKFKIGVFKTGNRKGQMHDHGTSITIDRQNLNLLFNEIDNKKK